MTLTYSHVGYDEGGYSASVTLPSFEIDFNLLESHWKDDPTGLANRNANILSFNILGAAFGALAGLDLNDRLGRLVSWRLAMIVWAIGNFIQVFSSGIYGLLLFARIFAGLGAGLLTVTSPLYLSEVAPSATRGLSVGLYMVILLAVLAMGKSTFNGCLILLNTILTFSVQVSSSTMAPVFIWPPHAVNIG